MSGSSTEDNPGLRPPRPRRVTAADVASAAGVSRSAVSRAFTPGAYLDAEKRAMILKTARQLGYRPNALAASLQGSQTHLVGVVAGNLGNVYDAEYLAALTEALNAAGKWPLVLSAGGDVADQTVLSVLKYPLDALIVRGGSVTPTVIETCAKLHVPIIVSGSVIQDAQIDCICCRNADGTRQAVAHLVAKGRRRFAYIGGPERWSSEIDRFSGVQTALADAGLPQARRVRSDYTFDGGARAAAELCQDAPPDAIIAANDAMALGALSNIRSNTALDVPHDLSIIGFDDVKMARWPGFDLTTLQNPLDVTMREILRLLEARLADPAKPGETVMIDPILIRRGTD